MPPSADLQQTLLLGFRVGERAALVTEQFAFEQRLGQRRTSDVDERTLGAGATVVDRLGHDVLSGSAVAFQQDRGRPAADKSSRISLEHAPASPELSPINSTWLWNCASLRVRS